MKSRKESNAKCSSQSRSTTDAEAIKKLEKELVETKRKLQDRGVVEANKAFEMEEMEINLRASVEELQMKVSRGYNVSVDHKAYPYFLFYFFFMFI